MSRLDYGLYCNVFDRYIANTFYARFDDFVNSDYFC